MGDMERDCRAYAREGFTIVEAAYQIGRDGVLNDPTDDEVILAAVEMSRGSWTAGFTVDREFARRIVESYEHGTYARESEEVGT